MNIEKNFKVIDSVFFNGEINYLKFRFTELNDSVTNFVVLESLTKDGESEFEKNLDKFLKWEHKITHIKSIPPTDEEISKITSEIHCHIIDKTNKSFDNLKLKQLYDLSKCLHHLSVSFDDIIMVSEIDEFPIVPPIDILHSYLSFEPLVFSQKDFIWSKDFIKSEEHLGTFCFSYSQFVLNTFTDVFFIKNKDVDGGLNFASISSGYRFSYFMGVDEATNKLSKKVDTISVDEIRLILNDSRDNLTYYDFNTFSNPKSLKKYFGELPKHINLLDSQKIGRESVKKHLITFNIDSLLYLHDEVDTISVVLQSNNLLNKDIRCGADIYHIHIPNKQYYDILIKDNTLENFQEMYFVNEVKKILYSKLPMENDLFIFYYGGKEIILKWSEIENQFLFDLLIS
jgi:hypothetical protein